ncbi:MAG: HAD-IB family hydrolase [Pseudomonadota bacterium]
MPGTAIFDLDKTITQRGTWSRFVRFAVNDDARFWRGLPAVGATALAYKLKLTTRGAVKEKAIDVFLAGQHKDALGEQADAFVAREIETGLRPGALTVIDAHKRSGDRLIIASAAVDLIVSRMANALGFDEIICTRLSWDGAGRLASKLNGENCYGAEKLRRVSELAGDHGFDTPTMFYSDHVTDLPCLLWADRGVAVNPHPPLRKAAIAHQLEIADWDG